MDATIIPASTVIIITTIITTTIIIVTTVALITLTNSAREIAFIGTTLAELSKIYFIIVAEDKPANMANASPTYNQQLSHCRFTATT